MSALSYVLCFELISTCVQLGEGLQSYLFFEIQFWTFKMREEIYTKFHRDGFLVLEDFLTESEADELRKAGEQLAEDIPPESRKTIFSTTQTEQSKEKYFLESSENISYFFEAGAVGPEGEFLVTPSLSLNKVGHGLHWLHPVFRKISFCTKVKEICFQLKMEEPVLCQSMYIYKNPGVGSAVVPHQDAMFLHVDPMTLVGFWIALDDATVENGCLYFIKGSHCSGVHRRFIRNPDKNSDELVIYTSPPPSYPTSNFMAVPVKKGTCVVIHGQVVHKSDKNASSLPRHAYTFHVYDSQKSVYSPENWLQTKDGFKSVYMNN